MPKIQKTKRVKSPVAVKIRDAEDSDYDLIFIAPQEMTPSEAVKTVDAAIRKVKELYPSDFMFEDLLKILEPQGFIYPYGKTATERW